MLYLELFLCIKRSSHLLLQESVSALKSLILHRQLMESQLCLLLYHSLSTGRGHAYSYSLKTHSHPHKHTRTSSRSSSGVQGVRSVWQEMEEPSESIEPSSSQPKNVSTTGYRERIFDSKFKYTEAHTHTQNIICNVEY